MEEIYTEFFHLIPSNLRMDYNYYKRMRNSSSIKIIKNSYDTYRTSVIMYFLKMRKKLKLPKESNWIVFCTFPIGMQIGIILFCVGLFVIYINPGKLALCFTYIYLSLVQWY